ncbi:hypothetical protein KSS87_010799 [Heliosperma pusillum]|nr:hypothetical protein KSS87_010799 [Heliosperma pusillum]
MDCSLSAEKGCCSDIHIPDVLLYDILSRLPSKSLMRFRCVCKSWYSLITHNLAFQKLHLLNFNSNNNGPRWIGFQLGSCCDYDTTKFSLYDESFASDKIQSYHIYREKLPIDFFFCRIVGSSNGVVCLYLPLDEESHGISGEEWGLGKFVFSLWNPSIRKYRKVDFPWKATNFHGFYDNFMMGFGLSVRSKEYKVVVISKDQREENHVYVYSLLTNSWSEIGARPCSWNSRINKDSGTYFNGSCHWIRVITKQGDDSMLCFNLDDENFRYISLPPKSQCSPPYDCFKTIIYMEMLSVWETIEVGESFAVNIWVMKKYGDGNSWSVFQRVVIKEDYWFQYRYFRLFGIDSGGKLLFKTSQDDSPLRAFDLRNGEIQEFHSCETVDIWDMAPYQESLALL